MPHYRIYTIGSDRHLVGIPKEIECDDDQAAIQKAKEFKNGLDLEIWERTRMIARLTSNDAR